MFNDSFTTYEHRIRVTGTVIDLEYRSDPPSPMIELGEILEDTREDKSDDIEDTVCEPDIRSPDLNIGDKVEVMFMYSETMGDGRHYYIEAARPE